MAAPYDPTSNTAYYATRNEEVILRRDHLPSPKRKALI